MLVSCPAYAVHEPASKLEDAVILPLCALVDQGLYLQAESSARELLPQVEEEWGDGSLETAEVLDVLTEALWRGGKATEASTLEVADRALQIRERRLGYDHPIVADSLVEKATVLQSRAATDEAEKLLQRARSIYARTYGQGDTHVAMVLNNLGNLYRSTGGFEMSRQVLEQALELYEALCGHDCVQLTGTLANLAQTFELQGDYATAEQLLRRELAIHQAHGGLGTPAAIQALHGLGVNLQQQGKYLEARVLLRRAVSAKAELLGALHPSHVNSLLNLAILESDLGHLDEAEKSYQAVISILEETLGASAPDTAQAWVNYGAFQEIWDPVAARTLFEKALEVFRASYGEEHYLTAWTETSLARVLRQVGDWQVADSYLQRAGDYWQENPFPLSLHIGTVVQEGELSLARGHLDAARGYFEQALELEIESHGEEHVHVAGMLNRLGEVCLGEGSYDEAAEVLARALGIAERTMGEGSVTYGEVLVRLGDLAFATEAWTDALGFYRQALSILDIVYAEPTTEIAELRVKIARCLSRLGSRRPATVAALQAEDIARSHLRLLLTGMPESEGLRFTGTRATGLDLAFSLIVSGAEDELRVATVDSLVRSRALVLDEIAGRWHGTRMQDDPAMADLVEDLRVARQRLAYLVVRGPDDPKQLARYTSLLEVARAERERAERALALASRSYRLQQGRRQVGLEQVAAALPEGSALVGYARVDLLDLEADPHAGGAHRGESSYVAFVLPDRKSIPDVLLLGYAGEIEDLVERVQSHLAEEAESSGVGQDWAESVYRRDAQLLRQRIWDPIANRLGNPQRIFVVADGALHLVNVSALPVEDSQYLVDRGTLIHYLSAERDLVLEGREMAGRGLLAFGDPDFDRRAEVPALASGPVSGVTAGASSRGLGRGACEDFRSLRFASLPGAAAELNQVVSLWNGHGQEGPGATEVRRGRASEAAFKQQAAGRQVIHLATHGFFLGDYCPAGSELGMTQPRAPEDRADRSLSPLLRAGLALAGVNRRQEVGGEEDDGILTAEEIASLDLEGVEWAVLSACESGLGEVRAGEGVLGLRRAFSVAGVRTLIMSLWRVDDEATREWMGLLYQRRFQDGLDTATAVHQATLELLQARRAAGLSTHPFYWAGFCRGGRLAVG